MEMLYKYYSNQSDYAFRNLEKGVVNFTPLISLNDPLEGLGTYKYEITEDEQKFWNDSGSDTPKLIEERFPKDIKDLLNFKHRILSTSKECTNPLLWAHYANSHNGFCVGYEKQSIQKITSNINDISYCTKRPEINFDNPDDLVNLLFVKSKAWDYEKECRAVYTLKYSDVLHLNKETYYLGEDSNFIYIPHQLPQHNDYEILCSPKYITMKCIPNEIYFGMNMTDNDKRRIFNIAYKYNVKFYQVKYSDNTFEFVAEEISKEYLEYIFRDSQTASY